ncbi:prolipoprotein diacylglyceryl transferase [Lachnospira multipara]|uniref:prolipoprotein diacylglyceryl transferase n=1 Tax=Lachnospira multipara TaxID=28051 RepID=UPI000481808B|nr:prolipoprotein diacylglyceryl transferase [Lachnospira multipara]
MKTDIITIGGVTIHGYGLMIAIGFILAIFVAEFRAKKYKLRDESVIDIALIAGIGGFLGAKLLFVIVEFKAFLEAPLEVLGSSGFVVYGGIIFGVLFNIIYCKMKKLNFGEYFDLVMPEIALAQGFGRLGCFLAGCCYGEVTTSRFGVVFPESSGFAPAGVRLVPTQLMSACGDFLNMALLMFIAYKFGYTAWKNLKNKDSNKKHFLAGDVGLIYFITYGVGRFIIEFFRGDVRGSIGVLSTSQFISVIAVVLGVVLLVINHKFVGEFYDKKEKEAL